MKHLSWYIILIFLLVSCNTTTRKLKKMQREVARRERIQERDTYLQYQDTSHFRWYFLSDSTMIGTPKLLR